MFDCIRRYNYDIAHERLKQEREYETTFDANTKAERFDAEQKLFCTADAIAGSHS